MKNVAIITGPVKNCGIHVYALRIYEILKHSKKYNFFLFEVSSAQEMFNLAHQHNISSVIYNWHPSVMDWCVPRLIGRITQFKQFFIIGHELYNQSLDFSQNIKAYLTIDPTLPQKDNYYPAIRPVEYYDDIQYKEPGEILKIGTSGFGEKKKGMPRLVEILNDQFKDEPIELNVHFSVGQFVDPSGGKAREALMSSVNLNPNIKLNVTHEFLDHYELVKWLNNNDINVYCYENYDGPGVSSSIDKAISSRKPFGVNYSNYFKHVCKDEINIEKTPIKEIIKKKLDPYQEFYTKWNPETLLQQYHFLLETYDP